MATIITKNSATAGNTPSNLTQGELAINVTDGRLFYGSGSGNAVKQFDTIPTASYAAQALSASWAPSVVSNPFPYTGSAIISGSLIITGSIQVGVPGVNLPAIDSSVGTLSRGTQAKVDWVNGYLNNSSGVTSVDWESAFLNDSAAITRVDWGNGSLNDSAGTAAFDWESRRMIDAAGARSADFNVRYLIYPNGTTTAINYGTQNQIAMTGSVSITGSLTVSGSSTFTNIGSAIFSGSVNSQGGFTGSLQGTASYATVAQTLLGSVTSASFAATASFVNALRQNVQISGSTLLTGSLTVKDPTTGFESLKVSGGLASMILNSTAFNALNASAGGTFLQGGAFSNQPYAAIGDVDGVANGTVISVVDSGGSINIYSPNTVGISGTTTITGFTTIDGGSLTANNGLTVASGLLTARNGATITGSLKANSITGSLQGTASYATQALSASWAPGGATTAGAQIFGNFGGAGFTNPIVTYLPFGYTTVSSNELQRQLHVGVGGTVKNFYLRTNNTATAGSYTTFTIRINGASSGIQIAVSGGQVADVYSNTTNTATINPGDYISLQVSTSVANGPQLNSYGFAIE